MGYDKIETRVLLAGNGLAAVLCAVALCGVYGTMIDWSYVSASPTASASQRLARRLTAVRFGLLEVKAAFEFNHGSHGPQLDQSIDWTSYKDVLELVEGSHPPDGLLADLKEALEDCDHFGKVSLAFSAATLGCAVLGLVSLFTSCALGVFSTGAAALCSMASWACWIKPHASIGTAVDDMGSLTDFKGVDLGLLTVPSSGFWCMVVATISLLLALATIYLRSRTKASPESLSSLYERMTNA